MLKNLFINIISTNIYLFDRLTDFIFKFFKFQPQVRKTVLYYHDIEDHEKIQFEKQIKTVMNTVPIYTLDDIASKSKGGTAITFDDAFRNILTNAIPFLDSQQVPATIFAPTKWLGKNPGWLKKSAHPDRDKQIATIHELQELDKKPLFSIESHTHSHQPMATLPQTSYSEEIEYSKEILEKILDRKIKTLSFPHGSFNPEILTLAKKAGYQNICSIDPRLVADNFIIDRFKVLPNENAFIVKMKASGAFRWLSSAYALKRRIFKRK